MVDVIEIRYFRDETARILRLDRYRNFISDELDDSFSRPMPIETVPESRAAKVIIRPAGSAVVGATYQGQRKISDCPNCP